MLSFPAMGCSSTPTATAAFFGLTFSTTDVTWEHRARSRSARARAVATSGEAVTMLTMSSPVAFPSRSIKNRRMPSSRS